MTMAVTDDHQQVLQQNMVLLFNAVVNDRRQITQDVCKIVRLFYGAWIVDFIGVRAATGKHRSETASHGFL